MRVIYNGIELEPVKTHRLDSTAVYDESGQNFLYNRIDIDIVALIHPAATSYYLRKDPDPAKKSDPTPVSLPGVAPALTLNAIRHDLAVPRKKLIVKFECVPSAFVSQKDPPDAWNRYFDIGSGIAVESPAKYLVNPDSTGDPVFADYPCDAKGGPYPRVLSITEVGGVKMMVVRWICETYLTECKKDRYEPPIVLSHNWRTWSEMTDDRRTILVTEGKAVFRRDELERRGLVPDQFRSEFGLPLQRNFRRNDVNVVASADGNEVEYRVIDEQLHFQTGADAQCKITSNMRVINVSPSLGDAVNSVKLDLQRDAGMAAMAIPFDAIEVVASNPLWIFDKPEEVAKAAAYSGARFARRMAESTISSAYSMSRQMAHKVRVEIDVVLQGYPGAPKRFLFLLGMQIVVSKLLQTTSGLPWGLGLDIVVDQELSGKYVAIKAAIYRNFMFNSVAPGGEGWVNSLLEGIRVGLGGGLGDVPRWALTLSQSFGQTMNALSPFFPSDEDVKARATDMNVLSRYPSGKTDLLVQDGVNPPLPNSSGMRGQYIGDMVAAALVSGPCLVPDRPAISNLPEQSFSR